LTTIDTILEQLRVETGASRVTLRRDVPGDYAFPVTDEALGPGVASLRDERTIDLRSQPVVRELQAGRQVVQDDCRSAYEDPAFHRMLDAYGGLAAQIVTPIFREGVVVAIVSVHQLGRARQWTDGEIAAAAGAAERVAERL
jgi:GAF domain-containing protein